MFSVYIQKFTEEKLLRSHFIKLQQCEPSFNVGSAQHERTAGDISARLRPADSSLSPCSPRDRLAPQ